ncbi:MAG TPA: serine protease [Planctomycetaceae bacterium]|nr:serine protease [Planctomycetaceae bacterium]HRE99861.1 trypsin-like peptidase domain-containing protein [Pirellulaceae bacterium]
MISHPCRTTRPFRSFVPASLFCLSLVAGAVGQESALPREADVDRAFADLEREAEYFDARARIVKSIVALCRPSVVHIKAIKGEGPPGRRGRTVEEAGAGVIIRHRDVDYVLTNRHVIKHADLAQVHLYTFDGRHANPVAIWTDSDTDIAVMRLPEGDYLPARCADDGSVEVGDDVVAIGSPFGLSHSVTRGIVSATGRRDLQLGEDSVRFQDFIQTDAAINPGNSGGPLINLRGRVVGINTAIASNSGGNDGIGFAIPIDMALAIAKDLVDRGRVTRGVLGVTLDASYTPDQAKRLGLPNYFGARVSQISPSSAADQAGIAVGDIILSFGGTAIQNDSHLVTEVSRAPLKRPIDVELFREGRRRTLRVTLEERDEPTLTRTAVNP